MKACTSSGCLPKRQFLPYILRGSRLCHYTVTVVVLAKKGYVYLKDDNNRTLESYTFADR